MASNATFTVNLTKEAFDRLCAIRDLVQDATGKFIPLNDFLSVMILQVEVVGLE